MAASTLECTPASEQDINNAVTLARASQTLPLTLRVEQDTGDAGHSYDGGTWTAVDFRLVNRGGTTIVASAANPLVVLVRFVRTTVTGSSTRTFRKTAVTAGTAAVAPSGDAIITGNDFTLTIRDNIAPNGSAGFVTWIRNEFLTPTHRADVQMTSFGVNDDVTHAIPAITEILTDPTQQTACATIYQSAVQQQSGNTRTTTLRAEGQTTGGSAHTLNWLVGQFMSTDTLGNFAPSPGLFGINYDGKW
ncbi:hypothetical protein B277_10835 [Janibacter hoylei PVAS-1]|uniref:Uncharacterized protein n=1 Tax=Janibacter hoylei PVAS-1 TaxID=1210046 RepID=K1E1E1_9MICO|nr:hypothetical protein [Janibacter hoylei]EKA60846.1 hypothetical protein B277_10835 [Janibacter hoylei PVAS-1]RWU82020.1 hypothetical protein CWN80_12245 [Janibacter hoylei PVAS-1]